MRKISGLRRRAVATAAMATALGGVPVVALRNGHPWVVFVCIGLQVILLTMAVLFLVRARRSGDSDCSGDPRTGSLTDFQQ